MKIINLRQENICYMLKDEAVKIDRSDVWGDPEIEERSLLSWCKQIMNADEDGTARVLYLYGQGGVGKSFVCGEILKRLDEDRRWGGLYAIHVDLQRQQGFEDSLKCIADGIEEKTGLKELFPQFKMAYYSYKLKSGQEFEEEERTTKWDSLKGNSTFSLVSNVAGMFTPLGAVSGMIDLADEGYKWFLKMKGSAQHKATAARIEAMGTKELKSQLTRFFAADYCSYMKDKNKGKKKFILLLDTLESMRYRVRRSGDGEDYLEWLAGANGLFRLLPGCFWMLFGREEIHWEKYDPEWKYTFKNTQLERPGEQAIREYLLAQFGGLNRVSDGSQSTLYSDLQQMADKIIRQTQSYVLAIENSVDFYFRIWNSKLRENRVTDPQIADRYRPDIDEIGEILNDKRGQKVISERFLMYYTIQEREMLYTLICLERWTDDILEELIRKGAVGNIMTYEDFAQTSFIGTGEHGWKSVQALKLDALMQECPARLKRQLLHTILSILDERNVDEEYWLLFHSALHIARFLSYDEGDTARLGKVFVKTVRFLQSHMWFSAIYRICEEYLDMLRGITSENQTDSDSFNAARLAMVFAGIMQKEDIEEKLKELEDKQEFGSLSLEVYKNLIDMVMGVSAYESAYQITDFLMEQIQKTDPKSDSLFTLQDRKVIAMLCLDEKYKIKQVEDEIDKETEMYYRLSGDEVQRQLLSAERHMNLYYNKFLYGRMSQEIALQKMKNYLKQYEACCTRGTEEEATLCKYKIWELRVSEGATAHRLYFSDKVNALAIRGMHILDRAYGDPAVDMELLSDLLGAVHMPYLDNKEDIDFVRRIFTAMLRRYSRKDDMSTFNRISTFAAMSFWSEGETDENRLSDIILQELKFLDVTAHGNAHDRLRIPACDTIYSKLRDRSIKGEPKDEDAAFLAVVDTVYRDEILLDGLKGIIDAIYRNGKEKAETEDRKRLAVFLKAAFRDAEFGHKDAFRYHSEEELKDSVASGNMDEDEMKGILKLREKPEYISDDDKRLLIGVLPLLGMEIDEKAIDIWAAQNTDGEGASFNILDILSGWQAADKETNAKAACFLIYVTWTMMDLQEMKETFADIDLLGLVINEKAVDPPRSRKWCGRFDLEKSKARFILALLKESEAYGKAFTGYLKDCLGQADIEFPRLSDCSGLSDDEKEILAGVNPEFRRGLEWEKERKRISREKEEFESTAQKLLAEGDMDTLREIAQKKIDENSEYQHLAWLYGLRAYHGNPEDYISAVNRAVLKIGAIRSKIYFVLRAYMLLDDKAGFGEYFRANGQNVWDDLDGSRFDTSEELKRMAEYIVSIGDQELLDEYIRQLTWWAYRSCQKEDGISDKGGERYVKYILPNLRWLTQIVPFEEVWSREACVKGISDRNYVQIYQMLKGYLSQDELLALINDAAASLPYWKPSDRRPENDPSFFESEYYVWLRETFGAQADECLRRQYPILYRQKDEYEKRRESFRRQIHKTISEIVEIMSKN